MTQHNDEPIDEPITITLTDTEWEQLLSIYCRDKLTPESASVFRDTLNASGDLSSAVFDAIRNEACYMALDALSRNVEENQRKGSTHSTKTSIWVTFQKEGIHRYPAAETDTALATGDWDDVSFLAYPHRHIFHFRVGMEVFHDDRDVEFIQLKRWCERLYADGTLKLDYKSCEMISNDLHGKLAAQWPNREITIEVSEDGENGSYTTYTPGEHK